MKINNSYTYINNNKNSFGAVRSVKCEKLFNPLNCKDDLHSFASVFLSDAFRYLIKHRDVSFLFERYYRPDEKRMATILHYDVTPIQTKKISLFERIKTNVKHYFLGNSEMKRHWLEGWVDTVTGEKNSLKQQISEMTVEQMKKYM